MILFQITSRFCLFKMIWIFNVRAIGQSEQRILWSSSVIHVDKSRDTCWTLLTGWPTWILQTHLTEVLPLEQMKTVCWVWSFPQAFIKGEILQMSSCHQGTHFDEGTWPLSRGEADLKTPVPQGKRLKRGGISVSLTENIQCWPGCVLLTIRLLEILWSVNHTGLDKGGI